MSEAGSDLTEAGPEMPNEQSDSDAIHDLIVVGAGSVGLTMAALWAQLGREAVLVERHEKQYGLPRAGHIDHEIMRLLQTLDAEDPVVADAYETEYYRWVNAHGETLLEFPWGEAGVSGWHSDFMQNSAVLEASLLDRVRNSSGIHMMSGWEAQNLQQFDDCIRLDLARLGTHSDSVAPQPTGETRTLRARYIVACDGASSLMRTKAGVERDDLGFNEKWLVVDARRKRDFVVEFDSGQICDPRRPTTILPLGKDHRRWEWHINENEDPAEFTRPEKAWELLADLNITPDDVEPVRQLVYTFEARMAQQWRLGRLLFAGDAAHTMPPFMGQGMCSGMRDAKNLAWKLDLVLGGHCDVSLLDSYELERRPHVNDWTVISLESGRVSCTVDPDEARRRDEAFREGYRPPIPEVPQLVTGVLHHAPNGDILAPAGELGVQGRVSKGVVTDLFDRLVPGRKFTLISRDPRPESVLSDDQLSGLEVLGTQFVHLTAPGPDAAPDDIIDVDGAYSSWMSERQLRTVIMRPDFYVFGGVDDLAHLPELVNQLLAQTLQSQRQTSAGEHHATAPR